MTRQDAERRVRARWERLGLDPAAFPIVFRQDVDNLVEGRVIPVPEAELPGLEPESRRVSDRTAQHYVDLVGGES